MSQRYQADGVSFLYPENWRLDREECADGWTVLVQSPGTAFLTLTRDSSGVGADEVVGAALEALRADYPTLDAQPQVENLVGQMAVGHDIHFFSLDLTNTCWTRAIDIDDGVLLILCQSNDLELDEFGPILRAICASLNIEED